MEDTFEEARSVGEAPFLSLVTSSDPFDVPEPPSPRMEDTAEEVRRGGESLFLFLVTSSNLFDVPLPGTLDPGGFEAMGARNFAEGEIGGVPPG